MSRLGRGFPNNALMRPLRRIIPIAYDATGAGVTHGGTGTTTVSHTLGTSANAVVVAVSIFSGVASPTVTAQIGTSSIPLLGTTPNFIATYYEYIFLFGLINPPTGAQTITLTISGGSVDALAANSVSYSNVAAFGSVSTTSGSGSSASHTISSAPGQLVVQAFSTESSGGGSSFSAYSQTQRSNLVSVSGVSEPLIIGDSPGAASVMFSATSPGATTYNWGSIAVPLIPAP